MAETISVVASVLTLLDYTLETLTLISEFRDVPYAVHGLAAQIKQLEVVIKDIHNSGTLDPNHDPLQAILQDCAGDISTLQERLRRITLQLEGKLISRTWGAIAGMVKEKEIEEAARKIERHKTTLVLVIQNMSLSQAKDANVQLSTVQHQIKQVVLGLPAAQTLASDAQSTSADIKQMISGIPTTLSYVEDVVQRNTDQIESLRDMMMRQFEQFKNDMMKPAALAQDISRFNQEDSSLAKTTEGHCSLTTKVSLGNSDWVIPLGADTSKSLPSHHCTCSKRPYVTTWGLPYSYLGTCILSKSQHRKACPQAVSSKTFRLSLQYKFPRFLINKAVHLSFSSTYGAGGFSLAPRLGIIPVTTGNNPARQIIRESRDLSDGSALILKLRQLFLDGKASPFDIDEAGGSLAHTVIFEAYDHAWNQKVVVELVQFLRDCGTNIDSVDYFGRSVLGLCFCREYWSPWSPSELYSSVYPAIEALVRMGAAVMADDSADAWLSTRRLRRSLVVTRRWLQCLRASSDFAEDVMKCGPLSLAVLERSESRVRRQLRDPAKLKERNSLGQTPLHLCGDWALGVENLLRAGIPCNQLDGYHHLPLDYSVSFESGARSAELLLKGGSLLTCSSNGHDLDSTLDLALTWSTKPGISVVQQWPLSSNIACLIDNVVWRRERLKVLADAHLPSIVLHDLFSLGTAIDGVRAHQAWVTLERTGVNVPSFLRTQGTYVYHRVNSRDLAQYLYDKGFRDLDEYDQYGRTPLICVFSVDESNDRISEALDLAEWYLSHGANPMHPHRDYGLSPLHVAAFHGTVNSTAAILKRQQNLPSRFTKNIHDILWHDPMVPATKEGTSSWCLSTQTLSPMLLLLLEKSTMKSYDGCICGCSLGGCTPTSKFLARLAPWSSHKYDSLELYKVSALLYNWYKLMAAISVPIRNTIEEVRRFVAFQKLDLKHTCCDIIFLNLGADVISTEMRETDMERRAPPPHDCVDDIRDEEAELLHLLEDMLGDSASDWWSSESKLDILLDVSSEGPPPTLRWANLWLVQRVYNFSEEACEIIRLAAGFSEKEFWESIWKIPGYNFVPNFESWQSPKRKKNGECRIIARKSLDHWDNDMIEWIEDTV